MAPLPDEITLRVAGARDVDAIVEMRRRVGMNVYRWALLDAMQPPHARCLVAVDAGDHIVAVGSGVAFGRLGIIGNMIVDEAHRRRGIGSTILDAIGEFLVGERGCTQLELTATADGQELYVRHGFVRSGSMVRAQLPDAADAEASVEILEGGSGDVAALAAWDAVRFGGDRSALLSTAFVDRQRRVRLARRHDAIVGYAVVRPADRRIGPWLAEDTAAAADLLSDALRLAPTVRPFTTVLPGENVAGVAWLERIGAALDRWDGRMRRGSGVDRRPGTIFGTVVGALG